MKEIHLDPLDMVLLIHPYVVVSVIVPSKEIERGNAEMDIAVCKLRVEDFIVVTTLYQAQGEETHTYQGNMQERNVFLAKLGVPPTDPRWLGE